MRTLIGHNVFAGDAVLGRTLDTTLVRRASDAPFSAPQQPFHSSAQFIHRLIHRIFQYLGASGAPLREKAQALVFAQPCYYYCLLLSIIKTAVVVGGVDNVDKSSKAFPDKVLRENPHVENFVDNADNLLKKVIQRVAQAALIACFFVQSNAEAAEILVNMKAIAHVESNENPAAWNRREDARGMYQLRNDVLTEWNDAHPREKHKPGDLFKKPVNEKLARWYLGTRIPQMIRHFKKPVTEKNVIIAFNAGIKYVHTGKPLPQTTVDYLKKYERRAA